MRVRRLLTGIMAATLSSLSLTILPAAAEPTGTTPGISPLSAQPSVMWQTDKTAWATAYSDGVLYVGGAFSTIRPPGAALGTQTVAQARLAAFDAATGEFIQSWRPLIGGGEVFALNVSPDGSRLYVGGSFTHVDGKSRRRLAAFDLTTPTAPTLLTTAQFNGFTNGKVSDIDSSDDAVYVGGDFTMAGSFARTYTAAFAAAGGALLPWRVNLTGVSAPSYDHPFVTAIELDPTGNVLIGGLFDQVDGRMQHGLAFVNGTTAAPVTGFIVPSIINTSYITAAVFDNGRLFIAGRDDKSGSTDRHEGVQALDATTGATLWGANQRRCLGDSFSLVVLHGVVWVGTHAHNCSRIGSFPETSPRFYGAVLGQDVATGEQVHFYPETLGRQSVAGSLNNVRTFATDGQRLFVGGGFTAVNGVAQQNLTVFEPMANGGAAPLKVAKPTLTANSTGGARVSWTASSDRDDRSLAYLVYRRNQATPFATVTADSTFWRMPTLSVLDSTAMPGASVFYKVRVTDGTNQVLSQSSATFTVPSLPTTFDEAVRADRPGMQWKFEETQGGIVADSSGANDYGTVSGVLTSGQSGALSSGSNRAAQFNGGTHVYSSVARANPSTYSMELWFKTTAAGGKLIGLGNRQTGSSTLYDRHVYMSNDGRLLFGAYAGTTATIASAGGMNDGQWHHVVATQGAGGMALYVDGSPVASNNVTGAKNYTGYLRVGGDNLAGWPSAPSSNRFNGIVDEVAFYTTALTREQVAQHFALR